MKKAFITIIFLLTGILIFGQTENNLQDGYQVFKYPNGTISSEGLFRNGKPEGYWKSYYVTGIKKSEGKYANFQLDSIWVFFDQTGDTIEKINYLFGKRNGYSFEYKKAPAEGLYVYSKELFAGDKKEGTAYFIFLMVKFSRH
jgi:antitoxin component YwqK of YwqJK toxin-antitoxin module